LHRYNACATVVPNSTKTKNYTKESKIVGMQDGSNAKQQVVERIKSATNILVTVSTNPSVDELSAALGLTLMLNKMDKHGTAVFSGNIPPAISFLEPNKTFENTVDSLRDFIIALDKEKADRLRYKVEDNVVKVFITPYRTTITQQDLQFSQGDFNVELVVALGVEEREDLDKAIVAHGRILHDATIATINARKDNNKLGSIDWQDENASSLCEMLMSLSEALQPNLLDEQISNALLTGIVAATDRFRNENTKPRVMTMAAQLMAAGANQQLIAAKLEEASVIPSQTKPAQPNRPDGTTELSEGKSSSVKEGQQKPDGEMVVEHNKAAAENALQGQLDQQLPPVQPTAPPPDLGRQLQQEARQAPPPPPPSAQAIQPPSQQHERPSWMGKRIEPPSMGGTLNATAAQALDTKLQEEEDNRNLTILSHDEPMPGAAPPPLPPLPGPEPEQPASPPTPLPPPPAPTFEPAQPNQPDSTAGPTGGQDGPAIPHAVEDMSYEEAPVEPAHTKTLAELEAEAKAHAADAASQAAAAQPTMPTITSGQPSQPSSANPEADAALKDAMNAYEATPPDNVRDQSIGAQPFPPIQHDAPSFDAPLPNGQPPQIKPHSGPMLPPMPDFSTLPQMPGEAPPAQQQPIDQPMPPSAMPPAAPGGQSTNDPGQFKIPG
jgi:hypothetical protein